LVFLLRFLGKDVVDQSLNAFVNAIIELIHLNKSI